ncbi:uncharacterized protein LOC130553539 [Triplophysa rosa]|uniref:uncharacterized protein LOC130553539 n=1 Tax=Triplophysa rosa TaxID=992332 RepID=UPI0025461DEE|nr:uncharacterized protein LOC130553539 [Triplophysa rosa]
MERSRLTVTVLIYGLLFNQKIYGAEIELKVRPGDNITLICDRPLTRGSIIAWIRNCSHENQPSLIIDQKTMYKNNLPRFSFLQNSNIKSLDLHIINVKVFDLGLYYCAEYERKLNEDKNGITYTSEVYYYGNQTTRLSLAEPVTASSGPSSTVSPPPVSDCFLCWTLLFSVCPVCVLLSSICVYCLCQKKTTGGGTDHKENQRSRTTPEGGDDDEVCYASLDVITRRPMRLKKKQSSDFSTYAPVRTDTVQHF